MQSTTNLKEQIMKAQLTRRLVQLSLAIGAAATLAPTASAGHMGWSDETLKREIEPLQGALAKLRTLS